MDVTARAIAWLLACLIFAVSAFWTPPPSPRISLQSLGLFLLVVGLLLPGCAPGG
jgi:hypothetical protein